MRNTLVDLTKPAPVHPVFGRAIGWRTARPGEVGAQPIWTQAGGADDDGGDGTGDDGGGGDDGADDGDADQDDKNAKATKDKGDGDKVVPQSKYDQIKKQLSEADRKKSLAEKELQKIKDKDKPEVERVQGELATVTKERDELQTNFTGLARKYAFVSTSNDLGIQWVNTRTALRVAELDDLEISADGTVEGIDAVLKQLAKDHPYLVKPKEPTDDGDDKKDKKPPVKSGSAGVGTKKNGKAPEGTLSDEELRKKFPSLRI